MADGNIAVEVSTKAAQDELERLRAENAALKRDLEYARGGLTKGRTRMRDDIERLTLDLKEARESAERQTLEDAARIQALASEAHAWWTAARDATGEVERLREVAARLVAGIDHLDKLAREWEPDHSSGADRRGWLLAKDARDDAARELLTRKA